MSNMEPQDTSLVKVRPIRWPVATPIAIAAGVGLLVVLLLWLFFWLLCGSTDTGLCAGIRGNPPWVLLSVVLVAPSLLVIWYGRVVNRQSALESQAAEARAKSLALRNDDARLRLTVETQIAERFARAAELLGGEKVETRLAAIYALERVSRESAPDHWVVMETLAAFVRQHAGHGIFKEAGTARRADLPTDDVQAALTVIGRREAGQEQAGQRLNLSLTNLKRADLRRARLVRANLKRASLVRANLSEAVLQGANLNYVELCGDTRGADLQQAERFDLAWLGANLTRADLRGASLAHADIRGAKLREAHLGPLNPEDSQSSTDLFEVNLVWADLNRADLTAARMINANLSHADLSEANLSGCNLTKALLIGANLTKANLTGANFNRADLRRARLKGAIGLTSKQLEAAASYEGADVPDELAANLKQRQQAAQSTPPTEAKS